MVCDVFEQFTARFNGELSRLIDGIVNQVIFGLGRCTDQAFPFPNASRVLRRGRPINGQQSLSFLA